MFCHIVAQRSIFEQYFTKRPFLSAPKLFFFFSYHLHTYPTVLFCYWHHISVTITCVTIQNTKTQKILEHPSTVSGECDAVVNYHDITFCEFSFKLICSLFFLFCCLFRYSSAGILPRLTESSLR